MSNIYFKKDYIDFFQSLSKNNNKDWFDNNRKTYEKEVKLPFKNFVQEVINEINLINPSIQIEPKDAIFRINRDIRFAKDKTPYKTNLSAYIAPGGRKDKSNPGFYFEFNHQHVRLYSGAYFLTTQQLKSLRDYIIDNEETYHKITSEKKFQQICNQLLGDKNKRLNKEHIQHAERLPILWHKNIYFYQEHQPTLLTKSSLLKETIDFYQTAFKFEQFLAKGMRYDKKGE